MDEILAIWETLHDAAIDSVTRSPPGDVRFVFDVDFIVKQLGDPSDRFVLVMRGVRSFEWIVHRDEPLPDDLSRLAGQGWRVYRVESGPEPQSYSIWCNEDDSEIRITAASIEVSLLSGRSLTVQEWCDASASYWRDWSERSRKNRPPNAQA